jgi:outer membrane protein TolC
LKWALGRWTLGAVLLVGMSPAAWAQAHSATTPSSVHVHGHQSGNPSISVPSATTGQPRLSWQDANRAVEQFPRGHVDLLRWEQKNMPPMPGEPAHPEAGQLTLERAMHLALKDEGKWFKPGMSAAEEGAVRQQVAAVRLDAQRLWVNAVVARQSVAHSRDILAVAQAGAELGQRMAQVGNWSRARQIGEELALWDARARADKAQLQADRALQALWQRIGAGMTPQALAQQLPPHLPVDLPAHSLVEGPAGLSPEDVAALQAQALQAHLRWSLDDQHAHRLMAGLGLNAQALQAAQKNLEDLAGQERPLWDSRTMRWSHAFENAQQARLQADRLARQVRADVQIALNALRVSGQMAKHTQAQVLRLHTELSQETLLRYNGMLKSTWDLLASARTRIDSVDAALQAQRQRWLAHADLMAVLAGLPYADSANATDTANPSNTRTAGH